MAPSKNFDEDVMSLNHDVIIVFLIYCWFGAIRELDSVCMVCNSYIVINFNLYPLSKMKTELNVKHSSHTIIALNKGTIFAKKCWFYIKNVDMGKVKGIMVLKGIFSETK